MKTIKKNAREHNMNKVIQELTAAGLHRPIDNKESLKKNKERKNEKDCYKNELNKIKKIETVYFT